MGASARRPRGSRGAGRASLAQPTSERSSAAPGSGRKSSLGEREERGQPPRDQLGLCFSLDLRDTRAQPKCHGWGWGVVHKPHLMGGGGNGGGAPPELP